MGYADVPCSIGPIELHRPGQETGVAARELLRELRVLDVLKLMQLKTVTTRGSYDHVLFDP